MSHWGGQRVVCFAPGSAKSRATVHLFTLAALTKECSANSFGKQGSSAAARDERRFAKLFGQHCLRTLQSGNLFQEGFKTASSVEVSIDAGVALAVGVHDQDARPVLAFLHHVGQVMAIVLGKGWAEDDQVKRLAAEGFLDCFAAYSLNHLMTCLLDGNCLRCKHFIIPFAV